MSKMSGTMPKINIAIDNMCQWKPYARPGVNVLAVIIRVVFPFFSWFLLLLSLISLPHVPDMDIARVHFDVPSRIQDPDVRQVQVNHFIHRVEEFAFILY